MEKTWICPHRCLIMQDACRWLSRACEEHAGQLPSCLNTSCHRNIINYAEHTQKKENRYTLRTFICLSDTATFERNIKGIRQHFTEDRVRDMLQHLPIPVCKHYKLNDPKADTYSPRRVKHPKTLTSRGTACLECSRIGIKSSWTFIAIERPTTLHSTQLELFVEIVRELGTMDENTDSRLHWNWHALRDEDMEAMKIGWNKWIDYNKNEAPNIGTLVEKPRRFRAGLVSLRNYFRSNWRRLPSEDNDDTVPFIMGDDSPQAERQAVRPEDVEEWRLWNGWPRIEPMAIL